MKKEILEYHPNGKIKHEISFWGIGKKWYEQFFDRQGRRHREHNLPDVQRWYPNEITSTKTYYVHSNKHNRYNPSHIRFIDNGKILFKSYWLNNYNYSKLNWQNRIKEI